MPKLVPKWASPILEQVWAHFKQVRARGTVLPEALVYATLLPVGNPNTQFLYGAARAGYALRIIVGLVCCGVGDVALELCGKCKGGLFLGGLAAFLLGHVWYCAAFLIGTGAAQLCERARAPSASTRSPGRPRRATREEQSAGTAANVLDAEYWQVFEGFCCRLAYHHATGLQILLQDQGALAAPLARLALCAEPAVSPCSGW